MPAACPALEDSCPDCPSSALCELVAGGWPLITPALAGMPAPDMPETRPVALAAPVESRLAPPPPPTQAGPATRPLPTRAAAPAISPGKRPGPHKSPAVSPGKRPLPGAMPFMPRGADVSGIAQLTPAAAYDAGYQDCAAGRNRRRRIYQGEGKNSDVYAAGWYAAARARWQARH